PPRAMTAAPAELVDSEEPVITACPGQIRERGGFPSPGDDELDSVRRRESPDQCLCQPRPLAFVQLDNHDAGAQGGYRRSIENFKLAPLEIGQDERVFDVPPAKHPGSRLTRHLDLNAVVRREIG